MEKICVLGGGSWGATIASHLANQGHQTVLWEFVDKQVQQMRATRTLSFLPQLKIPKSVLITSRMEEALTSSDILFSIVPSQFVRQTWKTVRQYAHAVQLVVSFSKGIEADSLTTMTEIIQEEFLPAKGKVAVLSGPSHAEEVVVGIPTAVVTAAENHAIAKRVQQIVGSANFRVYTNMDVVGVEICGAIKNIFAIACGGCDGLNLGDNTKSALITRGLNEMAKLGQKMGAQQNTFFGLAGMGDLVVTCLSKHSRNRLLGEKIGSGKSVQEALSEMTMVAEGYPTSKSAYQLVKKYSCDCPIITEIYRVLYEGKNIRESVHDLMTRPMHSEDEQI